MRNILRQLTVVAVCAVCGVSGAAATESEKFAPAADAAERSRCLAASVARKYGAGFGTSPDGKEIIVDTTSAQATTAGASWSVKYDAEKPFPIMVSAEAFPEKADDSGDIQIYVDVTYMDGTCLWGQTAKFDRALCGGKPFGYLMNTDLSTIGTEGRVPSICRRRRRGCSNSA